MRDLASLVGPKGVQLRQFDTPSDLIQGCLDAAPEVVVIDTAQVSGEHALATLIAELEQRSGVHPRTICIAHEGTMQSRLSALRAGAASYLIAPVSTRRLASRVLRMCGIVETTRYRILIMDRDQAQAKKIATMLATIGMETLVVADPMKILARMQAFRPNLVLMDLDLSGVTGPELTAIIRDHDDFYGIPILFLSAAANLDEQLAALKAGGDGFISKPLARDALIAAVEYRMRMSRWLQDRRTLVNRRETASGFLPRDVFMRHLDQIMNAGASRHGGNALLLVEIDSPQTLFGALGLTATEKFLRELEGLLSTSMAPDESATRMDDFRYALLTKRANVAAVEALAGTLCQQLAGARPKNRDVVLDITVSIGVGRFDPPAEDALAMIARAEKALTGAKMAGGNQVHVWSPRARANGAPQAESVVKRLVSTALAQDGFVLLFQPILALNQQGDEFYEAQIRLQTLDGEQMSPADFLSVAERAEMMPRIDRWVLRRAFEVMSAERSDHPRLRLLVHQSLATLMAAQWFPWFRDELTRHGQTEILPMLQFQMAEIEHNRAEAKALIERLGQYGIEVCVANVSGSREDISLLGRCRVSIAKLSFETLRASERARLAEIIQAFHARGIAVIAPGIDDQASVSRAWTCRPDFIQGSYIEVPKPELSFDFQRISNDA